MRRGEVWTVSGGPDYASKPRPAVIVQNDIFFETASITIGPITSDDTDLPLLRVRIEPDDTNGLRLGSSVMVDKVMTVTRGKLGKRLGRLSDEQMIETGRLLSNFLALA